jgi:hypothetical protein
MNSENGVVRLQWQKSHNRTVVRTTAQKAVRSRGSACAATVSCSTARPLRQYLKLSLRERTVPPRILGGRSGTIGREKGPMLVSPSPARGPQYFLGAGAGAGLGRPARYGPLRDTGRSTEARQSGRRPRGTNQQSHALLSLNRMSLGLRRYSVWMACRCPAGNAMGRSVGLVSHECTDISAVGLAAPDGMVGGGTLDLEFPPRTTGGVNRQVATPAAPSCAHHCGPGIGDGN